MKLKSRTFGNLVLSVALFFSMSSNSQNNSTFRSDNEHSGIYEEIEIKNPTLKWKSNLNGTAFSSPAISEGIVYIGSGDNHLYAINTANGEVIWKFETKGAIHSSPAVNKQMVYFTSMDGYFYSIDKNTGEENWKFKTGGEKLFSAANLFGYDSNNKAYFDSWDFYLSSPVIENDIVYFGSGDSNIYALDTNTGEEIWKYKTGDVVHSSPAISNGILYCGSYDSYLYAIDIKTGQLVWKYLTETDEEKHLSCGIQSSPSVSDNVVFFGSRDTYLYAVDAKLGKLKWKQQFKGTWMPSSVAIENNKLHVGSSHARKYFSLNKINGEIIGSLNTFSIPYSSPAISGEMVFIGSFNGYLYAFNKGNGKTLWTFQTDASKKATDKYITPEGYIKDKLFEGLNFKEHSHIKIKLERFFSLGAILSSPIVDEGTLYFSSADGFLYAIN